MARYTATLFTSWPPDDVFAYIADLRNLRDWDPSVRAVGQVDGDGAGVRAVFDVTVQSGRRSVKLRYTTVTYRPPNELVVAAETWALRSEDRVDVFGTGSGTTVVYDARLDLRGPLGLADRWLQRSFNGLAERATAGLRAVLNADPSSS